MSIDIENETLISLADAAKRLPARRAGKRPHVGTLYRWSTTGCRGVVLETCQVGATRCTSIEALGRFVAALTAQSGAGTTERPTTKDAERRRKEAWADIERRGLKVRGA